MSNEAEIYKAEIDNLHSQLACLLSVEKCACFLDDDGFVTDRCIYHAWINKRLGRAESASEQSPTPAQESHQE